MRKCETSKLAKGMGKSMPKIKDMATSEIKAKLRPNGQVTLPSAIRQAAHLEEGDLLAFEILEEGAIVMRPQKTIDASQAWFWTPEWLEGERQASREIEAGQTKTFASPDEFFDSLD